MIKHGIMSQLNGSHLLYVAFVFYANYQVFKWVFNAVKTVATSSFINTISYKLTPKSVIKKQEVRQKLKVYNEKKQKEKDHQESLENHRKYKALFFTLSFIAEDLIWPRFGGHEILWYKS